MARKKSTYVLRTVYLTPALDRKLTNIAFHAEMKKTDLIRTLLKTGLKEYEQERRALKRLDKFFAVVRKAAKRRADRNRKSTRGR